ncbi:DNA polymerase III subunit beta [Leptolyngbya sp. AN03gr2]|uniref:DNA polymerase III subunit beta n=1 Tax=unclassified Leptolyngbya TaxID=2650499 RepID=UPI003D31AAEA
MEFTSSQADLNGSLALVIRAVASRPTHPILANILLDADESAQLVRLTAFDLSLGIESSFPARVIKSGKITLPAELLKEIVSKLPADDVTLQEEPQNGSASHLVKILSNSGKYQIRGLEASEFPELPEIDKPEITLMCETFIRGIKGSLPSASSDETKQLLTGIHLSPQSNGLEFAATDGHRLAVVTTTNPEATELQEDLPALTIPAKALAELVKLLEANRQESIQIKADQSQITFDSGKHRLTSRLLEGQYPNYKQLLPRQFTRSIVFDRKLFLGALGRVAILAEQKNNIIKMTVEPGLIQEVVLSVDAQDVGNCRETVPVQAEGEEMEIAFNIKYLADALKVMQTTEVKMNFNTSTSPTTISPVAGDNIVCLIMPVQIRS